MDSLDYLIANYNQYMDGVNISEYEQIRKIAIREIIIGPNTHLFNRHSQIAINPGWFILTGEMVNSVAEKLTEAKLADHTGKFIQIKEKFANLRVHFRVSRKDGNENQNLPVEIWNAFSGIIAKTENHASRICEACGAPGKIRQKANGVFMTACDEHGK